MHFRELHHLLHCAGTERNLSEINLSRATVIAAIVSIWRRRLNAALHRFRWRRCVFILWREVQRSFQSTTRQAKQRDENGKRSEDVFHYQVARKFKSVSIIAGEDTKARVCRFPATGII
jgi:hypothetical protein